MSAPPALRRWCTVHSGDKDLKQHLPTQPHRAAGREQPLEATGSFLLLVRQQIK